MRPSHGLLFLATLVLLDHLTLSRATPVPGRFQCLNHAQNLLEVVSSTLKRARQTLTEQYSCTAEKLDPEDITKDKTSTLKACLPLELVKNGNCLAPGKTSLMMTPCLSSIYEDLKMYKMEFNAINAKLLMDPKRQIFVDQSVLAAIDELMQALNFDTETVPQEAILEEPDLYKTKFMLCKLLHAFRIRAVTINRVMKYLNSS